MKFAPLSLFLSVITLAPCAIAQETPPKWKKLIPEASTPEGLRFSKHVIATYPEHVVELLVYSPELPGKYPAILDIHGGGWSQRQIESDRPMMERLAQRGFVTALVSYRLSTEAPYPAALHDCKAAIRFMRANAQKLQINPEDRRYGRLSGRSPLRAYGTNLRQEGV